MPAIHKHSPEVQHDGAPPLSLQTRRTLRLKDIAVWDEEDQEFRRASLEERFDAEVAKFVLDPWGSPYWYRETRSRSPDSCLIRNRSSADIWSVGPDRENQTLAGVEDSDDLGNW